MSNTPDLSIEDAIALVDGLSIDKTEWRHWSKRSDAERLAMGCIILQKHMRGASMRQIEKEMGLSLATVSRYKERALQAVLVPTVDAARAEELERIDTIIAVQWPLVEAGDEKATNLYFKAAERKAKLLGLDRPIQIEQTVHEVTAQEAELQALLAQAERDALMEASKISEEVVDKIS
jgi:Trp operon repressor